MLPTHSFLHVLAEILRGDRILGPDSKDLLDRYGKIQTGDLRRHFKFIDDLKTKESGE